MSGGDGGSWAESPRLGALEQQVMDVLWDAGASTIREVITALGDHHAYTTIATVMTNLARKQLVTPARTGRSVRYAARQPREIYVAEVMGHALAGSNDRVASILHFVDAMDPREAQLLRDYLARQDGGS